MPIVEVKSYTQGELTRPLKLPENKEKGTTDAKVKGRRKKKRKQIKEESTGVDEAPQAKG